VVEQVTVGSTAIRIDCNRVANVSRQYLIEELIGSGLPCLVIDGITLTSKVGTAIAIALDSITALLSAEISITGIQVLGRARFSFSSCYTAMLS